MKRVKEKLKQVGLLMGAVVLSGVLTGCSTMLYEPVEQEVSISGGGTTDNEDDAIEPVQPEVGRNVILYNNQLMGIYENGFWQSLSPVGGQADSVLRITMSDLLDVESYILYDDGERVGATSSIGMQILEANELGGVDLVGDEEILRQLGQPIDGWGDNFYQYTLPLDLSEDLIEAYEEITVPNYSFPIYVGVDMETANDESYNNFQSLQNRTVVSQNWDINPAYIAQRLPAAGEVEAVEAYAKDILGIYNMRNEVLVWKDGYQGDLDGDGESESLYIAANERSEEGYPIIEGDVGTLNLGVYVLALYVDDDGTVTPVYENCIPFTGDFTSEEGNRMEVLDSNYGIDIDVISLADLNGDHRYEIGIQRQYYESGDYVTYTLDENNRYMRVLKSQFGS